MATFYFNGAVDNDWATLGNWWMDDQFSIPATILPTSADDVIATASIYSNSGSEPTVANFTINDPNDVGPSLGVGLTVTGTAAFNGSSHNSGTITGNATFNGAYNNGTITGDATFSNGANNDATVSGNATFNNGTNNIGTVTGDATFNDSSFNNTGTVTGNATFNDNSYNGGTVTGNATFNDSAANGGAVTGDATFNDGAYNAFGGLGNATFTASAYYGNPVQLYGAGSGAITFSASTPVAFAVTTGGSWGEDTAAWVFSTAGQNWTFSGSGTLDNCNITGNAAFRESAINNYSTVTGNATFSDDSFNNGGMVTGDATFNDNSYNNSGTVTGDATFNDSSFAYPAGTYNGTVTFQNRTPYPLKRGVNSSSLLAVV